MPFRQEKNTGFNNKNLTINANLTKSYFIGFLFFCKWMKQPPFAKLAIIIHFKLRNSVFFLQKVTYADKICAETYKNKATNQALDSIHSILITH